VVIHQSGGARKTSVLFTADAGEDDPKLSRICAGKTSGL
jgi:hypothetical protein